MQPGDRRRQALGALALDPQLFVRRVERRPGRGLGLIGSGARVAQSIVELRRLGARRVKVTRQPRCFGDRRVEQPPTLGEVVLGSSAGVALLPCFVLGFEPLSVNVSVGLYRGVEIAVERLGTLDFLLQPLAFLLQLLAFLVQLLAKGVAQALDVVEDAGEALVLGALGVEVVLHRLHGGLGVLLYFWAATRAAVPAAVLSFRMSSCTSWSASGDGYAPFLDTSRRSFKRLAESAELLYGRLHLAHEEPVDESGRFLCGVVAKVHWGRGRCGPATHANAGAGPKARNSA